MQEVWITPYRESRHEADGDIFIDPKNAKLLKKQGVEFTINENNK
ncbi:hypothetical protein [Sulfuricurvum sp.]